MSVRLTEAEFRALLRAATARALAQGGGHVSVGAYIREAALAAAAKGGR